MVPASQTVPMTLQNQYFANWNPYCGQAMMFVPGSPFYPGDAYMHQQKKKRKKRCKKKKKKKKKDSESDTEAEYYIVKRNGEYCDGKINYFSCITMKSINDNDNNSNNNDNNNNNDTNTKVEEDKWAYRI